MDLYYPPKKKIFCMLSLVCGLMMAGFLPVSYAGEGMAAQQGMKAEVFKGKDIPAKPGLEEPDWKHYKYLTPGLWKELGKALNESDFPGPGPSQTWECRAKFNDPNTCILQHQNKLGCNDGGSSTICKNNPCRCASNP